MSDFGSEMTNSLSPNPEVYETEEYDNLISSSGVRDDDTQPPKPKVKGNAYPFSIKVHTWSLGDTEKFALLMKRPLSSDKKGREFTFKKGKTGFSKKDYVFTEQRENPFSKKTTHKERREAELWTDTMEFVQDGWTSYMTFKVTFETEEDCVAFCRLVKHRLTLNTQSIHFPQKKDRVYRYGWKSKWENPNPIYPIYIVSKGRGDTRYTARSLEKMGIPYYIVIEPQDYDEYECVVDPKWGEILVLPFSNHGDGPGRARNWCWDHSKKEGFKRHWVMDDNINGFVRLHKKTKRKVLDGGMFRVCEEFVDRFKNVPVAGLQYRFFCDDKAAYPPFVLNTRIYSCLLIENSCPHRWRGRYNEDTILSLDVLKNKSEELCVMQFNNLLQNKLVTQALGGGNTEEFYGREGTYNKSKMLEDAHPDVAKVVWRYGRYHHHVNYDPFKSNQPIHIDGYDPEDNRSETDLFDFEKVRIN